MPWLEHTWLAGGSDQLREGAVMRQNRQQLMFLCSYSPDLESAIVAWALYDGSLPKENLQMGTGSQSTPPYESVLDAMRDGWKVMQVPAIPKEVRGHENEAGYLPWEYVLQREVEIDAG